MIEHTLGVVLVGGASRRMGIDKAGIDFGGRTLLERSVVVTSEVFSSVVVSGPGRPLEGLTVVPDLVPLLGPIGGLDAVYHMAQDRSVFLLAVDMPFVDADTVRSICESEISPMSARVPFALGRRQPLCAVYGSGLGPTVSGCLDGDDRSMARLLGSIAVDEINGFEDEIFNNVNTAQDLESAVKRFDHRRNTR